MYSASINHQHQKGFTLLEVVLVLFILAIITSTSLSFIENEDAQNRYQESLRKLNILNDAILAENSYRDSKYLSGFVIDNGALPATANMDALASSDNEWSISSGEYWEEHGNLLPYYFDSTDNENQIEDQDFYRLDKGFRGPYISEGLDGDNEFKDSWGEDFSIDEHSSTIHSFTFDSSSPITQTPFSVVVADVKKTVSESDWTIAKESLNITVNNNDDGSSPGDASAENFRVVVVVFSNNPNDTGVTTDDGDLWQSFYFDATAVSNSTSIHSSGYSWSINTGEPNITRVPAGEHLVLLLDTDISITNPGDDVVDFARVTVFPSAGTQPEIILEYIP